MGEKLKFRWDTILIAVFSVIAAVLLGVIFATTWYRVTANSNSFKVVYTYNVTGQNMTYYSNGEFLHTEYRNWTTSSLNHTQQVFVIVESFVIVGAFDSILVAVAVVIRLSFTKWKILWFIISILAPVLDVIAWCYMFAIQSAFTKDSGLSTLGFTCSELEKADSKNVCSSFMGSNSNWMWGPDPGWWMIVGAFVSAVIAMILVLIQYRHRKYTLIQ